MLILWRRKFLSIKNSLAALTAGQLARDSGILLFAAALIIGFYLGFERLLGYLKTVPLIGLLILWKLTAMAMLTTFMMVIISSVLTSLSTLYYSYDLKFLFQSPFSSRTIFIDKSLEVLFFSSWMVGLLIIPYVAALSRVNGYGANFFLAFIFLMPPFLWLAASFGIILTLLLLYFFPSSRTRDAVWIFSSLSLTLVYGLVRFAQPEKLVRPDTLRLVADYLNYLQAPTAGYLPSWWVTKAISAGAAGSWVEFWRWAALLWIASASVFGALVFAAGFLYSSAYSGAQEGPLSRRELRIEALPEKKFLQLCGLNIKLAPLLWKDRKAFFRDVRQWSQLLLVLGLVFVYLFSIAKLPLDDADLKSLISFLNVGAAGAVLAALALRFTFPAISLEGRQWWILKASPIKLTDVMRQKFIFSAVPLVVLALILAAVTNYLLSADRFSSTLSLSSLLIIALALASMGVGFGALFPKFDVENIHQIESSLGGFIYMAASLFYIGLTIAILAWPMRMHFEERFGRVGAWRWGSVLFCGALWLVLNAVAFIVPWSRGQKALEAFEP